MKVLHIANMNIISGVASFLMNYYRYIDREKIQFDFLSFILLENNYAEEIRQLGGNVYNAPSYKKNFFKHINFVSDVIVNGNYDIIHCHQFLLSVISLSIAKKNGIKTRIIHSHNNFISSKIKRLLVYLFKNFWSLFATDFFACSEDAANFLFGKKCKYKIFNNAIEPERFIFDNTIRSRIRNYLGLAENAFVIGYVARFVKEKNHLYLIDVFKNILQQKINAYLLLVGTGVLQDEVKKYADDLNISKNVLFHGITEKVHELYSVMDVFVFPSLFEGLGIVGIEAQCAGLPVIASLNIPKTMQITPLVCWLDLKSGAEKWAEKALEYLPFRERADMTDLISQNGYNIKIECKKLEAEYLVYEN
jgi:glycosyltransferase involved in cell wall biosynthesis